MIADVLTVMWKERRGLFYQKGSRKRVLLPLIPALIMVSIYLPWQAGRDWVDEPVSLLAGVLVPMLLVGMAVPDSFAGERERHTLGTLLSSRLPDRAILFGKVLVAVAFGWGALLIVLLISLVTVNIIHWGDAPLFYKPSILFVDLGLGFLLAGMAAGAGVLISLRASTVQDAAQMLMAILMVVPTVLGVVVLLVIETDPGWVEPIKDTFSDIGFVQLALISMGILIVLNAGLLLGAVARFQRARLILD